MDKLHEKTEVNGFAGYFRKHWHWICIGIALTPPAVLYTYEERGYAAFGGEWLMLPVILMAVEMIRVVCSTFRKLPTYMEDTDGAESNKRDRAGIQAERF